MSATALIPTTPQLPTTDDLLTYFGAFLRLHVADGDASPNTLRSYLILLLRNLQQVDCVFSRFRGENAPETGA
jgi:hypothetical protein